MIRLKKADVSCKTIYLFLSFIVVLFSGTATVSAATVTNEEEMIINALKRFSNRREDTTFLAFLKTTASNAKSPYTTLANFMISMIYLTERDTFKTANYYAEAALTTYEKNKRNQTRAFKLRPTVPYYQIMGPKEKHIQFYKKYPHMLIAYTRLLNNHARLFYILSVKPLLYEVSCCFRDLNPVFYNSSPQFKTLADSTQLWMTDKMKELPME